VIADFAQELRSVGLPGLCWGHRGRALTHMSECLQC